MKGIGTLAILAVGVLAALYLGVDTMLLGRDIPVDPSRVPLPDANEAGDAAQRGANATADQVASWDALVWRWIVIGVLTTIGMVLWNTSAKFKGAVIGGAIVLIAVIALV